jgi:hypothetical protein
MWKATRRGYLELSEGVPLTEAQIARVVGCTAKEIRDDVAELEAAGVFSREAGSGVIFSRRLVREERHREISRIGGGVVTEAKTQAARRNGTKGGRPETQPKPNRNPTENQSNNQSDNQSDNPTKPNPHIVILSEGQRIQNTEESAYADSCSEPLADAIAPEPASPPILVFTITGQGPGATRPFTELHAGKLTEAFAGMSVVSEAKKALAWIEANPSRRKTARGMPAFLHRWLSTAANRGGGAAARPRQTSEFRNAF